MAKKVPAYLSDDGVLHHSAESALMEDMRPRWFNAIQGNYGPELSGRELLVIFDFIIANREVIKKVVGDFECKLDMLIKGDSKC